MTNKSEINQTEIETVNSLLDQTIKLSDPKTARGLKRAQSALKEGHSDKAKTEIIKAFDGLSDTDQMGNLNQSQLKSIEQMISRLYRQPQSTSQKVQSEIDRLLNRSYQASQRDGSQVSYLYLLLALDRAGISIENTPRHFQKQVKTWLNSINKDAVQIGGALPVVSSLPALSVSPPVYLVGGLGLGLVSILLIIVLFINRKCQKSLKQKTEREMQQTQISAPGPLNKIPSVYGSERPGSETIGTERRPTIYGQMPQQQGLYGTPPSLTYSPIPQPTYAIQPEVPVQASSEYGQLPIVPVPVNIPGVGEAYDAVPPQQEYGQMPYDYGEMPPGSQ